MNSDLPEVDQPALCGNPPLDKRHHNLLLTCAVLAAGGAIAAAAYGISKDLFVLRALAIDMALTVLAVLPCMNARRLQQKAAVLEQAHQADTPPRAPKSRFSRWEGGLAEVDDAGDVSGSWDIEHAQKLHFMFLALVPTAVIVLLAARGLWISRDDVSAASSSGTATALALVSLAASCLWLILARSYHGIPADELPESPSLGLAFREVQWASLLTAASLLVSCFWPAAMMWAGRLILGWVIILGGEQFCRLLVTRLRHSSEMIANVPPLRLLVREAVFLHGNSAHGLFDSLELVLGVSFRSSWTILFVRRSLVPATLLVALLFWALSSLAVVQVDELGVRESFGRIHTAPLSPGLHWKLPWPCGRVLRYSVKRVSVKPVGFVNQASRRPNLLWSKKHAEEEFALVLGDGSELVAAGCVVYYKIHEDRKRFLDYVYQCQTQRICCRPMPTEL